MFNKSLNRAPGPYSFLYSAHQYVVMTVNQSHFDIRAAAMMRCSLDGGSPVMVVTFAFDEDNVKRMRDNGSKRAGGHTEARAGRR